MQKKVNIIIPATPALVQKAFSPFTIKLLPEISAFVCVFPASEPAVGSVNPNAPIISPVASLGKYFLLFPDDLTGR